MTEVLRSWILSVAGIIVFGSMCEMILPGGNYKKYIQLTIGLMLVLAFLSPFVTGMRGADFGEMPDISTEYKGREANDTERYDDIVKIYKEKLCDAIKSEIGSIDNAQITCDICEDKENFGKIKMIKIEANGAEISDVVIGKIKESYGLTDSEIVVCDTKREDAQKDYGS